MPKNTIFLAFLAILTVAVSGCQTITPGTATGPHSLRSLSSQISISAKKPWSYHVVSDPEPVRAGKESERFELRHGDCGGDAMWNDCITDRGRTERIVLGNYDRIGQESWYGFSIYLSEDFEDIDPSSTHIFQWKATKWREPLATFSLWRDHLVLSMQSIRREKCLVSHLYNLRGKWMDFVVHTKWSSGESGVFEFWINGEKQRHECSLDGRTAASGPMGKVLPHWGIYQSYVSRWLARKSRNDLMKKMKWEDYHRDSGHRVESVTYKPFEYDWGVELPTGVAYFDELRIGPSREAVDIRMIEGRGGEAVD